MKDALGNKIYTLDEGVSVLNILAYLTDDFTVKEKTVK